MPTPPRTCSAPVFVEVADVIPITVIEVAVIAFTPVIFPPVSVKSPPLPPTVTLLLTVSSPVAASNVNSASETFGV